MKCLNPFRRWLFYKVFGVPPVSIVKAFGRQDPDDPDVVHITLHTRVWSWATPEDKMANRAQFMINLTKEHGAPVRLMGPVKVLKGPESAGSG